MKKMNNGSLYHARFMFDPGSGTCLWSANDRARARHGYSIDHSELDLPQELVSELDQLIERYDRSIDWNDPGGPSPWNAADGASFRRDAMTVLERVKQELAPGWSIDFDDVEST